MSKPISVSDAEFEKQVIQAQKPVLVDFWATWCKPCTMISPIVDELALEFDGKVNFVKVDIDKNPKTAAKYNVRSIPTLLIFKNGEPITHVVGLRRDGAAFASAAGLIRERFGDDVSIELIDLTDGDSGDRAKEWTEKIEKRNLSLPLLLVDGQVRISGQFDIRQLTGVIEIEKELGGS
jgi:thioredoxin 1